MDATQRAGLLLQCIVAIALVQVSIPATLSTCTLPANADEAACSTDDSWHKVFRIQDHLPAGQDFFPNERAMVPFALIGYRMYGRGLRPPLSQDLLDAAFLAVAEDYQTRLKVGVELYSTIIAPSTNPSSAKKTQGHQKQSSFLRRATCPFDAAAFQSVDIIFRFSIGVDSFFIDYAGHSAMHNMLARHEMMKTLGFKEVYWLPVSAQSPQGETLRMLPYLPLEPTLSQRITLHFEGTCLHPFTSEKETATLVALTPLLIQSASIVLVRIEKVLDEKGDDGGVVMEGVTISLIAAVYEHDEKMTLEEALSDSGSGLLADGPEGQPSPLEAALANVGLLVQTVTVKSIHPINGSPPITLHDWVKFGLCPSPPNSAREKPSSWGAWPGMLAGALLLLLALGFLGFARHMVSQPTPTVSNEPEDMSQHSSNLPADSGPGLPPARSLQPAASVHAAASLQSRLSSAASLALDQQPSLARYSLGRTSVNNNVEEPDDTIKPEELVMVLDDDGSELVLGSGSFGKVYKGIYQGNEPVAIKIFSAADFREASDLREILLLRKCRSDYVVQFKGVAPVADALWLVMEFMEGGNLQKALASGPTFRWQGRGKAIALDIAKGMAFLHSQGVIHMDLKSPNILLTADGHAKVADVGLSRTMGSRTHASRVGFGTFDWTAPEVLVYERATYKADVFSFGVILWEIVTGKQPKRSSGTSVRVPEECCADTEALINRCLAIDYRERPTGKEVVEALQFIIYPERAASLSIAEAAPLLPSMKSIPPVSASELRAVLQGKAPPHPASLNPPLAQATAFDMPPGSSPRSRPPLAPGADATKGDGTSRRARGGRPNLAHASAAPEETLRKRSTGPGTREYNRSETM